MKAKIILSVLLSVVLFTPTFAYETVTCDSDPVFAWNSCTQCFDGKTQSEWDTVGFISDEWINDTQTDMILYKEIQEEPRLVNLSPDSTEWSQVPSSEGFWEYTSEFDNIYSEAEDGYLLKAGKKITWIKSKLGYGYQLGKNSAVADQNIWLLIFPITTHALLADGSISQDDTVHNECVLFKSGTPKEEIQPITRLPETGPAESAMLILLAMILWFVVLQMKRKS